MTSVTILNLKPDTNLLHDFESDAIINGYCIDKDDKGNYINSSTNYLYEGWILHYINLGLANNNPKSDIADLEYEIEQLNDEIDNLKYTNDEITGFIDNDVLDLLKSLADKLDMPDITSLIESIEMATYY